jgi:hypothetical protein
MFKARREQEMIAKENEVLLKKLVEISTGKRSSIPGPKFKAQLSNKPISIYPGQQQGQNTITQSAQDIQLKPSDNPSVQSKELF